jgi:excisionase family DNA binding protein
VGDAGDLTLQEAADALDVHYMTAYRYVRLGVLPAQRRGRAWAVARADLDAFIAERSSGPVGAVLGRGSVDWSLRLQRRLLAGDRLGSKNVVEASLAAGTDPVGVYVDVVGPAMRAIGDGWASGGVDVAEEHRASVVVTQVLALLDSRFTRRGVRRGVVVVGAVAGDRHALPVRMVADVVRLSGYEVDDLGADVPVESFAHAAGAADPLLAVALSATTPGNEDVVQATVAAVRERVDVPVLVGGGAVPDAETSTALGGDGWAPDARGVVELLEAFQERRG